ncbi:MAG: hypothetical protein ACI8WM_002502 [Burkholderiaceae bacterium]|jgi:hypothetical protein
MMNKSAGKYRSLMRSNSEPQSQVDVQNVLHNQIVRGVNAVRARSSEHGIVDSHVSILSDLAEDCNVVFGIRPVNPLATQLLAQGYPTKGLNIKGKSADWGPMAGFIPVQQAFSKLVGESEAIELMDSEIDACIKNGYATSLPLVINQERLDTLIEMKVITKKGEVGAAGISLHAKKNNLEYTFNDKLVNRNRASEYAIFYKGKPVQVLATVGQDNQPARALTADYDLLLFAVPLERMDDRDNYKSSLIAGRALAEELLRGLLDNRAEMPLMSTMPPSTGDICAAKSTPLPITIDDVESELDRGVISPRLNAFILDINNALGRTVSNEIVQHGADTQNPYTVTADNYPNVIFLPRRVGPFGGVAMARNKDEAVEIYKDIKNSGFQFFGNEKWADEMPEATYRRSSFDEARDVYKKFAKLPK